MSKKPSKNKYNYNNTKNLKFTKYIYITMNFKTGKILSTICVYTYFNIQDSI